MTKKTRDSMATLYQQAKERNVPGRSSMSKSQLRQALSEPRRKRESEHVPSLMEAFSELAEASAHGKFVALPRHLTGQDRRRHVRQCLREDHENRIAQNSEDTQVKFDKLSESLYKFFRGTAFLFYRDMAGDDAWMPTVLALGDVHPKNFGVMPNADNVPFFSVNDFDEAFYGPFTWDIKRGAVGFIIAAEEEGKLGRKHQRKIARDFTQGYIDGIRRFATKGTEQNDEVRLDTAPTLIRQLIRKADKNRGKWLRKKYLNETRTGFRTTKRMVPVSSRRDEFQTLVGQLLNNRRLDPPARAGNMRVKDVAIVRGKGTGSMGLNRYYVLIEGPEADGSDDIVLEFKQARRSAMAGLVPPSPYKVDARGDRIAHAHGVHVVRGDRFYGSVQFDGLSYMSRERSPFREKIDLGELSKSEWRDYAAICGWVLAHAHALSDDAGDIDYDIEPAILEAMGPPDLFLDDIVSFSEEAADRVRRDHVMFRKDHRLAAFNQLDVVYQ